MGNQPSKLGAWGAAGLSLAGLAGFFLLFVPRMDVYGVILAPVIFAVYQIPAALLYGYWKKRRAAFDAKSEADGGSDRAPERNGDG